MTTFSDDFNRADGAPGANWVLVSGLWVIVSDQLSSGTSGATVVIRAATAMATNDNYAQITIAATTPVSQGVFCRGDSTLANGYVFRNDGTTWAIFKVVSSAFTSIGTYAAAAVAGDVARVQAVGSTITGWVNGVIHITVTDTSVTSGTGTGLRAMSTSGLRFDNFAAADVATGATLGIAASTETAQALTSGKAATLSTAGESGGAQVLIGTKAVTVSLAGAAESAQPLAGALTVPIGLAATTDAAQGTVGTKTAVLAYAAAEETAQPLAGRVTAALGVGVVTEAALILTGHVPGGAPLTGIAAAGLATGPSATAASADQVHASAGIGPSAHATGGSSP